MGKPVVGDMVVLPFPQTDCELVNDAQRLLSPT
jgi:hypothetical protein